MKCATFSSLLLLLAVADLTFGRSSPKRELGESQGDLNSFFKRESEKCGVAICRRREDLFIPKPEDPIPVIIPEGGGEGIGKGGGVDPPLGEGGGNDEGGGDEEGEGGEEEGGNGEEGDENPELPDLPSPNEPSSTDDPSQPITPATATNEVAASQSSGLVSSDAPIFRSTGKLVLWSSLTLSIFSAI